MGSSSFLPVFLLTASLFLGAASGSDVAVTRQVIDGEVEDIQWFSKDQRTGTMAVA